MQKMPEALASQALFAIKINPGFDAPSPISA
jgi:hypothetical protein